RLQTMNPGNLLGELGFFLGETRSATVTTDSPATIYMLTKADRERMLQDNPAVAAAFNELIIRVVGKRLVHQTRELGVLLR
ncbi:MAG: cyclic nucleotide-binding domain-containing protein, partial [Candidatus Tectomicrobia bacterium]